MPCVARGVVQRRGGQLLLQALAQTGQQLGFGGQAQRQGFVLLQAVRHQFRQPHGLQQAGPHAAGKAAPGAGQHRQARPQRVTAGGVGVVGPGVQEKVTQLQAAQVLVVRQGRGKVQALGGHTTLLRFMAQVGLQFGFVAIEQEHAAWNALQQPHPHIKHGRHDLVGVVQATKHQALIGQAGL